ncbi:hypothetical protein [Synechococcus sp. CBW1107]|uniref:hypothetical protein n=1 Tax=Synechococcus sp. CBW1107 TaxID=2789857 RepID=UPI002AD59E25|nr:hypothetical protein [Synechococcus sp. CBW1107]
MAIRRESLVSVPRKSAKQDAESLMAKHDFDVVPVCDDSSDLIINFWKREPDPGKIIRKAIRIEDLILASTPADHVLEHMLKRQRKFFFVRTHMKVTGLVTVSDFNDNPFRISLFSRVAILETLLCKLIEKRLATEQIVQRIKGRQLNFMHADKAKGFNHTPIHYLYLSDLLSLCLEKGIHRELGFASRSSFEKMNSLNDLRNQAAHTNRSILHDYVDVQQLTDRLFKLDDLSFRVRAVLHHECDIPLFEEAVKFPTGSLASE